MLGTWSCAVSLTTQTSGTQAIGDGRRILPISPPKDSRSLSIGMFLKTKMSTLPNSPSSHNCIFLVSLVHTSSYARLTYMYIDCSTQSSAHTLWLDFVYHIIELILIGSNIEDRKCVRCAYCWVDVYSNIEDCKYFDRKKAWDVCQFAEDLVRLREWISADTTWVSSLRLKGFSLC